MHFITEYTGTAGVCCGAAHGNAANGESTADAQPAAKRRVDAYPFSLAATQTRAELITRARLVGYAVKHRIVKIQHGHCVLHLVRAGVDACGHQAAAGSVDWRIALVGCGAAGVRIGSVRTCFHHHARLIPLKRVFSYEYIFAGFTAHLIQHYTLDYMYFFR